MISKEPLGGRNEGVQEGIKKIQKERKNPTKIINLIKTQNLQLWLPKSTIFCWILGMNILIR